MELKLWKSIVFQLIGYLLIVPYGIETLLRTLLCSLRFALLIVPYGIET